MESGRVLSLYCVVRPTVLIPALPNLVFRVARFANLATPLRYSP